MNVNINDNKDNNWTLEKLLPAWTEILHKGDPVLPAEVDELDVLHPGLEVNATTGRIDTVLAGPQVRDLEQINSKLFLNELKKLCDLIRF
jgi:hypothetical protein